MGGGVFRLFVSSDMEEKARFITPIRYVNTLFSLIPITILYVDKEQCAVVIYKLCYFCGFSPGLHVLQT